MRRGDHHEVAPSQQLGQPVDRLDRLHAIRRANSIGKAVDAAHRHPKRQGPPRDLTADSPHADNPHRGMGKVDRRPIHRVDVAGAGHVADPSRLAAPRLITVLDLLANIRMQIAGKTEDIAHHLVGDHVAEKAAHIGEQTRMFDQFGKHVMLEAGRERLHPRQAIRPRSAWPG